MKGNTGEIFHNGPGSGAAKSHKKNSQEKELSLPFFLGGPQRSPRESKMKGNEGSKSRKARK